MGPKRGEQREMIMNILMKCRICNKRMKTEWGGKRKAARGADFEMAEAEAKAGRSGMGKAGRGPTKLRGSDQCAACEEREEKGKRRGPRGKSRAGLGLRKDPCAQCSQGCWQESR
ncbi:hypothetical protein WR25_15864 [Diploscapter pachys]|uniref:Uncharacterized protein n=1 Tax=Diploscapter pachys TaxID=2018661 RepID=A0A2A2LM39_9BILA|nr:hypothetical protein WR25_15864 [Diploscapter pachys]